MNRIRDLREDSNKSQAEVAKFLGLQQNSYSQIETGKNTLQIDHLVRLSKLYDTSTDYILGLTNEKKPYPKIWHKYRQVFIRKLGDILLSLFSNLCYNKANHPAYFLQAGWFIKLAVRSETSYR